jgi:5-formyltetrahydrofolate cyclo-ligase
MSTITKNALRKEALKRRRALHSDDVHRLSRRIGAEILGCDLYNHAQTIMAYLAMPDEPQVNAVIADAWLCGKTVCVPHLRNEWGIMDAAVIHGFDELVTGKFNLSVPDPHRLKPVAEADIDVVLVPGVAFDKYGNRLGMGAGYYDRFLSKAGRAVFMGVCFSFNVLDYIPSEPSDLPVHYLVTELGIVRCSKGKM